MTNDGDDDKAAPASLAACLEDLRDFVLGAARNGLPFHDFERGLHRRVLRVGHAATAEFLHRQGPGDLGPAVTLPDGRTITPDMIESVDRSKWDKFYVFLRLNDGSPDVRLDLLRHEPLEEWFLEMERLSPGYVPPEEDEDEDEDDGVAEDGRAGADEEAAPDRRMVPLEPIVNEVRESAGLGTHPSIGWINAIERGLTIDADPDQLFRILLNLARNAVQALESRDARDPGRDQIRITGRREGAVAVIEVSDTGPGIPETAHPHLFEPFKSSTRSGGSGLGLVIVAELVRAHDGDIRLVEGTIGATFRVTIPDRPVVLQAHRDERARA